MTDVNEPRLDKTTLRDLAQYADVSDEQSDERGEPVLDYGAVWAVHGPEDGMSVEYPILAHAHEQVVVNSASPAFGEVGQDLLGDDWYRFLATTLVRIVEEGEAAHYDMFAFAPDDWDGIEAWAAHTFIGEIAHRETVPFEIEWAVERGMDIIEEDIGLGEVQLDDE